MAGQGLQFLPLGRIPEKWDPSWFVKFVREVLAKADIRNAIEGGGISITGQPDDHATVSTSADLTNLLTTTFVTVTPSGVSTERVLTGESGIIDIIDGGANSTVTVKVTLHGLPLAKLVLQPSAGVLGNKFATASEVALIAPSASLQTMSYDGVTVDFRAIDSTYVSDFAEAAQDAVGTILVDSSSIDFTYTDATPSITATVITANPSALVGLAAVNGAAATPMRSDAAPALDQAIAPTWSGKHIFSLPVRLPAYTVGTLPAGALGDRACVTDATAPTFLGALVGAGAVKTPVFHNGTAWVAG